MYKPEGVASDRAAGLCPISDANAPAGEGPVHYSGQWSAKGLGKHFSTRGLALISDTN
jgi:hypothetical protein